MSSARSPDAPAIQRLTDTRVCATPAFSAPRSWASPFPPAVPLKVNSSCLLLTWVGPEAACVGTCGLWGPGELSSRLWPRPSSAHSCASCQSGLGPEPNTVTDGEKQPKAHLAQVGAWDLSDGKNSTGRLVDHAAQCRPQGEPACSERLSGLDSGCLVAVD